jgi:hypothetical protein
MLNPHHLNGPEIITLLAASGLILTAALHYWLMIHAAAKTANPAAGPANLKETC